MGEAKRPVHFLGNQLCPRCGENVSGASPVDAANPKQPVQGNFSICAYCAEALVMGTSGRWESATAELLAEFRAKEPADYAGYQRLRQRIALSPMTRPAWGDIGGTA